MEKEVRKIKRQDTKEAMRKISDYGNLGMNFQ
jgi:hypothetical protein